MPRRRCVGCGRVAPKPELVRLAAVASDASESRRVATLDPSGTLPGRGAYLCRTVGDSPKPKRDCMELALKRGVLQRAFRRPVGVPSKLVESESR